MTDIKPEAIVKFGTHYVRRDVYDAALLQAREEGRREGMREAEKYLCEAIVATQGDRDGYLVCDVADLLRLFNERKAITRAAEGK